MSHVLTPLSDRVIATREEAATRTASGLYLPDSAKEKAIVAVIEAVGPDVKSLKVGDKVVYKEYSTTEIKVDNKEYLVLKEEDVLAKVGAGDSSESSLPKRARQDTKPTDFTVN